MSAKTPIGLRSQYSSARFKPAAGVGIVGIVLAVQLLVDIQRGAAWAQSPSSAVRLLELPLIDQPDTQAASDVTFASTAGRGENGTSHVWLEARNVMPAEFAQPDVAGPTQQPSYLGGPAVQEQVPAPTYLDSGNEELSISEQLMRLNQRMFELETASTARDDATRTIIRQTFSERGASINDYVVFGGTIESLVFWADDFDGVAESDIVLDTAEIDFEIQISPWALGSLVMEYDNGTNLVFPTTDEEEFSVDRLSVRQAWVTIGDVANYPLFTTIGRDVVPFGISTGDPVADVLTISDPLTVEVFEMSEDFVLFGFAGPVCCPPPPGTPLPAPPVRPMFINPLVRRAATSMFSYCPCTPPIKPAPTYWPPIRCQAPFTAGVYFFNGETIDGVLSEDHIEHMGGTVGYFRKGTLPFGCIPWSVDFDVDATSSVFDSDFLEFEYRRFLPEIGYVPGMAAHVKSTIGPTSWVVEWNGALTDAEFIDDVGTPVAIRPSAWQLAFAYQFDWNPSVEIIGAQGTYFVIGYSESSELAGVTKAIGDPMAPTLVRVGNVPEQRLSVGMGEWVLPGLRVALEYSHAIDYAIAEGGTGNSADGVFMQMTFEW